MGHRIFALTVCALIAAGGCASAEPLEAGQPKTAAVKQAAADTAAPATASEAAATAANAVAPSPAEQKADASLYYVDFRVAQDGVVGHTYIAHGRLGANGRPATARYVDYHPAGGFGGYVAGFIAPMEPVMEPAKEMLASKVVDSYRLRLSARDYGKLTKRLAEIRASRRPWSAFGYNCNDLLADAARALGLSAPMTNVAPYQFIPSLRAMNGAATSLGRAGRAPAPDGPQAASVH